MLALIVSAADTQPSGGYTVIGTIDADETSGTMASATFRPYRRVTRSRIVSEVGGLTTPEIDFPAGWDGGDVTIVGTDSDGEAQTEVITASAGSAVAAANQYETVTALTAGGVGTGGNDATCRCSEGWHVQIRTTAGVRVNVDGTVVATFEGGSTISETYAAGDICWGDLAIIDPASTATGCVARGYYGKGR